MLRGYGVRKSRKANTRKLAQARIAVARAGQVLRARTAGSLGPLGPGATRGFYGLWQSRGRNELKVLDTSVNTNPVSTTTGTITLLNGVATGTDYVNRIGRKIIMKSLLFRLVVNPIPSGSVNGTFGDILRYIIVLDMQPNGVTFSGSDLLLNTGDVTAPLNLNNRDRFKVIADKMFKMPSFVTTTGSLTAGSPAPVCYKIYKKMSQEVIFNATGSTIGSIQTGALFCFQVCSTGVIESTFTSRVRFIDG